MSLSGKLRDFGKGQQKAFQHVYRCAELVNSGQYERSLRELEKAAGFFRKWASEFRESSAPPEFGEARRLVTSGTELFAAGAGEIADGIKHRDQRSIESGYARTMQADKLLGAWDKEWELAMRRFKARAGP
jgi:hypothetical protein